MTFSTHQYKATGTLIGFARTDLQHNRSILVAICVEKPGGEFVAALYEPFTAHWIAGHYFRKQSEAINQMAKLCTDTLNG